MTAIYDPREKGFPETMFLIDRCQVVMLRELAGEGRLILKGGLAMRVTVGSMRLTKDVDFDRGSQLSIASAKGSVKRALQAASQSARLLNPAIDFLKATETTIRARLTGNSVVGLVRFVAEISGRNEIPNEYCTRIEVIPPASYGIAPFVVTSYTHDMLAASKVLALMSANRNVPRDLYDLKDLISANPASILKGEKNKDELEALLADVFEKASQITFDQARQELLPYVPPKEREVITRQSWEDMTISVAERVHQWLTDALKERPPEEIPS